MCKTLVEMQAASTCAILDDAYAVVCQNRETLCGSRTLRDPATTRTSMANLISLFALFINAPAWSQYINTTWVTIRWSNTSFVNGTLVNITASNGTVLGTQLVNRTRVVTNSSYTYPTFKFGSPLSPKSSWLNITGPGQNRTMWTPIFNTPSSDFTNPNWVAFMNFRNQILAQADGMLLFGKSSVPLPAI
jgi:hypothetical protein